MRNKITHEYFGVDEDILWKTIKEDLPPFKKQIIEILKKIVEPKKDKKKKNQLTSYIPPHIVRNRKYFLLLFP